MNITALKSAVVFCSLVATLLTSGCVAAIGTGRAVKATTGQQLVDLQKARKAGALSEAEYQSQRAKVLAGE